MNSEARWVDHPGWPAGRPELDRDVVGARHGLDLGDAARDERQAGLGFIVYEDAVADSQSVPFEPDHARPRCWSACAVGDRCRLGKSVSLQLVQAHQSLSSIGWVPAGTGKRSLHRPH